MNIKKMPVVVILTLLIMLSGCGEAGESLAQRPEYPDSVTETQPQPTASEQNGGMPTGTADNTDEPEPSDVTDEGREPTSMPINEEHIKASNKEEIKAEIAAAIEELRQPAAIDISNVNLSETPELDIKNIYYELIGEEPELKYAYDISAETEQGILRCQISYMPYKTGQYNELAEYVTAVSLEEIIYIAESNIGREPVQIQIADSSLAPDDISRALGQVGGGYVICSLNTDGTEIIYNPAMGMTMEECLSAIGQAERLADQVISQVLTDGMTEYERAKTLYSYVTEHVKYDQRYYSDRESMPYEAQTALGALRDNLAICGGYSHAVKLLLERAGICCYNVNGSYYKENHMWNVAYIDGMWRWLDATADRGSSAEYGLYHFALETLDTTKYIWDESSICMLLN